MTAVTEESGKKSSTQGEDLLEYMKFSFDSMYADLTDLCYYVKHQGMVYCIAHEIVLDGAATLEKKVDMLFRREHTEDK